MNDREKTPTDIWSSFPLWSYQLQRDSKLAVRTRKNLEAQLIARSFEDEAFKKELLANPKAVVEKELGTKLPEGIEIKVLEETETTLYMVLPSNTYEGLSEPDLMASLGMTLEDVARWVLEQQRNTLLDETSSVAMIARAWKDEAFKQELLRNPKAVIEKECGSKIPEGVEIQVLAEKINLLYFVLPRLMDDLHFLAQFQVPGADEQELVLIGASRVLCPVSTFTNPNCP